jgi:hypothetical protein
MDLNVSNTTKNNNSDKLFEKLNSSFTIKEKIEVSVIRYDYNYFLETNLEEILLPKIILPLQFVTRDLYNKYVSKDQKAKSKKLSWVLKNQHQEFCAEFRHKYENNEFKSVREAESFAANIYSKFCDFYQSSKATVHSVNGIKTWIKKRNRLEEDERDDVETIGNESQVLDEEMSNSTKSTDNIEYHKQFKRKCLEEISSNFTEFKNNVNLAAIQLKNNLEKSNVLIKVNVETLGNDSECLNQNKDASQPINVNLISVIQVIIDKDNLPCDS